MGGCVRVSETSVKMPDYVHGIGVVLCRINLCQYVFASACASVSSNKADTPKCAL